MKKTVLLFALIMLAAAGFSQKVKIKEGIAYLDGAAYLKWDKRMAGNEVSISSINAAEEEIYAMYLDYSDPAKITKSNPEGKVRWIELNFLTLKKKCEIPTRAHGGLVKFIYENGVYADNVLNAENVDKLVTKYGMRYSESRPGGKVTIIINE